MAEAREESEVVEEALTRIEGDREMLGKSGWVEARKDGGRACVGGIVREEDEEGVMPNPPLPALQPESKTKQGQCWKRVCKEEGDGRTRGCGCRSTLCWTC